MVASLPAADPLAPPEPAGAAPLLAVCGLCGGAGASTLAYLVARNRAGDPARPVLVCDTGGPTGGLAAYARVESPRTLAGVTDAVAAGEPLVDGLFAAAARGLRVVAGAPELWREGDEPALARVLYDAREAHVLTVVDCGTLARPADRWVLARASHVAWVLPATPSGVLRGRRVLDALPPDPDRRELIVARHDVAERRAPMSELKQLAAWRGAPLVLVPHLPDLVEHPPQAAVDEASVALAAIDGALAR